MTDPTLVRARHNTPQQTKFYLTTMGRSKDIFSGKKEDWNLWKAKFTAIAHKRTLSSLLKEVEKNIFEERKWDMSVKKGSNGEDLDEDLYQLLVEYLDDGNIMVIVQECRGQGMKAWQRLERRYTTAVRTALPTNIQGEILDRKLKDASEIDTFLSDITGLCLRLSLARNAKVTDDEVAGYILRGIPLTEEFSTVRRTARANITNLEMMKLELINECQDLEGTRKHSERMGNALTNNTALAKGRGGNE